MRDTELSATLGVDASEHFTDVVSVDDGQIGMTTVPTDVNDTEQSVIDGAAAIGAEGRAHFHHASTVELDPVITRKLAKIGFLATVGQRDMPDVGRTSRPLIRDVPDDEFYVRSACDRCSASFAKPIFRDDASLVGFVSLHAHTVRGDRAEVNLSGSSRPAGSSINGGPDATTVPLIRTIFEALAPVLGNDAIGGDFGCLNIRNANGLQFDGAIPWVTMAPGGGEHGPRAASKVGDGDRYNVFYEANNVDSAVEAIEADLPVGIMRKEYVADTAGAGCNRGGGAVLKDTLWRVNTEHHPMPVHFTQVSRFGVNGGQDGRHGRVWMWQPKQYDLTIEGKLIGEADEVYWDANPIGGIPDPQTNAISDAAERFYIAREAAWSTRPNARFRHVTSGGGWGDPAEREPDRVRRYVPDEYAMVEDARTHCGVVVEGDPKTDPEGLK